MSAFYCDSSALVKRYLTEIGSVWTSTLLDPSAGHTIFVAAVTRVETAAAIASRNRAGGITVLERDRLVQLALAHFDSEYRIVDLDPSILSRAVELTQNHRLRGYDAVQVATALLVNEQVVAAGYAALTLVSADNDVNAATQAEGLQAENPNHY